MYDNQLDYRALQRRAAQAAKRQQARVRVGLFLANIFLFVVFILMGWGIIGGRGLYDDRFFIGMLFLSLGWFTSLILHGSTVWMQSERGTRGLQQRAMAREIARLGLDHMDDIPDWDEKAKRRTRLTEDGELVEVIGEAESPHEMMRHYGEG
jgi:hypothetical protein